MTQHESYTHLVTLTIAAAESWMELTGSLIEYMAEVNSDTDGIICQANGGNPTSISIIHFIDKGFDHYPLRLLVPRVKSSQIRQSMLDTTPSGCISRHRPELTLLLELEANSNVQDCRGPTSCVWLISISFAVFFCWGVRVCKQNRSCFFRVA